MKRNIKIEKEVNTEFLEVEAEVRYWDDSELNGEQDDKQEMPCKKGKLWCPIINIDKGIITNWTKGNTASIHYKVCDCGTYILKDENLDTIIEKDGYVPNIMSPKKAGYGDYIIMDIDKDGKIDNWEIVLDDFFEGEDEYLIKQ